jgi:hypothetical protein
MAISTKLLAQNDFLSIDKQTYDYYMNGDYRNLKRTADTMLSQGMDYYYLRMRLGILSYNNELYSSALKHFNRALEFNSGDTLSREYIYYSYLFSGRKTDALLYLETIPWNQKNIALKSLSKTGPTAIFAGSSASGSDVTLYNSNSLYYEAVKSSLSFNAGFESYFSNNLKGTFAFTNFRKAGTAYSESDSLGTDLNFSQNQVYAKLTGYLFPGWEFSGFGHVALYSTTNTVVAGRYGRYSNSVVAKTEYTVGGGISKNGWKIRAGANISLSNLGNSNQMRGEGYITWLPSGNLKLYLTSGGMYQNDINWGKTYQINQEIGLKLSNSLWLESGIVKGNSFLYARNQGYAVNNSFQSPATTIYSNIIILPGKHFSITVTPFFTKNDIYSWDLNDYTRTDKLITNSFGGSIKLIYKNK